MSDKSNMIMRKPQTKATGKIVTDISYDPEPYNNFYHYISGAFRILSFILFAVLLLYITITAFNNATEFSYENFEYIIRNFALTLEENKDSSIYSIEYNPDANRSYSLFGKGLSVCGSSGISVYSSTGRQTCSESFSYKEPKMVASDKFALVYDHSNADYSLYNSFSRVYSDRIDGVIRGAAVADNGYFALITSSDEYNTAVELYDDSFSLINRFNKLGYVVDIDISDKYLMIVTASSSDDNSFETEIQVYDFISRSELFRTVAENDFPLGCSIVGTNYVTVGTNYTAFYNYEGQKIGVYDYKKASPCDFSFGGSSTLLLFKEEGLNIEYAAVMLNEDGTVKYEKSFDSTIFDIAAYNGWLYCLTESNLICCDGVNSYDIEFDSEHVRSRIQLLAFAEGSIYVCTDTSAPLITIP